MIVAMCFIGGVSSQPASAAATKSTPTTAARKKRAAKKKKLTSRKKQQDAPKGSKTTIATKRQSKKKANPINRGQERLRAFGPKISDKNAMLVADIMESVVSEYTENPDVKDQKELFSITEFYISETSSSGYISYTYDTSNNKSVSFKLDSKGQLDKDSLKIERGR